MMPWPGTQGISLPSGLTTAGLVAHKIQAWGIVCSQAGSDQAELCWLRRRLGRAELAILRAKEVIALNQDALGVAGDLVWKQGPQEAGPLSQHCSHLSGCDIEVTNTSSSNLLSLWLRTDILNPATPYESPAHSSTGLRSSFKP